MSMEYDWEKKSTRPALPFDCTCFAAKKSKYQMPYDQIMEYKHSTLQLGLEAGNVNKSEKIITTNRNTALFISKPVKCRQQRENKEETIRDKRREEKR